MILLDQAVAALRSEQPAQALQLLEQVLATPELPAQLRGPALGMQAQALIQLEQLGRAKGVLRAALKTAKQLGDTKGLQALRQLNAQLYAQLAHQAEQQRLAAEEAEKMAQPLEELLAQADTPAQATLAVIAKANALAGAQAPGAQALALQAWERAHALPTECVRERVLARLCQARANPTAARDYLSAARDLADRASEFQLLAAVVQAAKAQQIVFPPKGAGLQ